MNKLKNSLVAFSVAAAFVCVSMLFTTLTTPLLTSSAAEKGPLQFYLTTTEHNGAQALSACAAGYHMASIWEILDPSNLRYNTQLGYITADSGFGPPTAHGSVISNYGWVRTGANISPPSFVPGVAHCHAWTSDNESHFGTRMGIFGWESPGTTISPWDASTDRCNVPSRVWCVQDW